MTAPSIGVGAMDGSSSFINYAALSTAVDVTCNLCAFAGWYDSAALTGSPVTAIGATETGDKVYWAK